MWSLFRFQDDPLQRIQALCPGRLERKRHPEDALRDGTEYVMCTWRNLVQRPLGETWCCNRVPAPKPIVCSQKRCQQRRLVRPCALFCNRNGPRHSPETQLDRREQVSLERVARRRAKTQDAQEFAPQIDVLDICLRQFPVNESVWRRYVNSCMWAAVHLSKDGDQFQRVFLNMDVESIQKVLIHHSAQSVPES